MIIHKRDIVECGKCGRSDQTDYMILSDVNGDGERIAWVCADGCKPEIDVRLSDDNYLPGYIATRDGYDGAPDSPDRYSIGYGKTAQEAIDDLLFLETEGCHL